MNNTQFAPIVRNIIGNPSEGGLVRVTVERELYLAMVDSSFAYLNKQRAPLKFTTSKDLDGNYVETYKIRNVDIHRIRDNEGKATYFLMNAEDAKKNLVPYVKGEKREFPVLNFKLSSFDLSEKPVNAVA